MAKVIMTCGKLCAGKTTYAERLCRERNAVLLSIDEFMLAIFGQDAGEKHDFYASAIEKLLLKKSAEIVSAGADVVLDWGFWTKEKRSYAREFYRSRGIEFEFHYIDVSGDVRKRRIESRNASVSAGKLGAYYVDEGLFKKCDDLFEPPGSDETDIHIKE